MSTLDELESRLQTLVEVQLLKSLPGYRPEYRVHQQLAAAMHNSLKEHDGVTYAPNVYVIIAHPSTVIRWQSEPRLILDLAEALRTTGEEAGFQFFTNPTVTTAEDKDFAENETRIIASFSTEGISDTHGMPSEVTPPSPTSIHPPNAFLILGGATIIPLVSPVMNIGRRLENQVVVDDPRVSRTHAQLRLIKGRFVIFDLNSTGGTFVNGQRTNKSILTPGDVISLAGVTLIFGQDLPSGRGTDKVETRPGSAIVTFQPDADPPGSRDGSGKEAEDQ